MLGRVSFKAKLTLWLVGINVLIVLFIILYFPNQSKKQCMSFVYNKAAAITKMTASATIAGLEFSDETTIKDALNLLKQIDEFKFATVFSANHERFTGLNDDSLSVEAKNLDAINDIQYQENDKQLLVYQPVFDSNQKKLGTIMIGYSLEETIRSYQQNFRLTLYTSIIMLIITLLFSVYISRMVTNPIHTIIDRIKDIAQGEGDLTQTISLNTQDEFGELANWFNIFVDQLKQIIAQIRDNVNVVDKSVVLINDISAQMIDESKSQSHQIHQVASSIEQITATIMETSTNANHVTDEADRAADISVKGTVVVDKAIEEMKRIAEIVHNAAEIIKTLGKSSDEIGEVISVIDNIADQTNLLALNAAIEAARAGEQGRGFSVVADEVRKLAVRTTNATKEITDMINSIQKDTAQAVESTELGTQYVERGVASSNEAGRSLSDINQRIKIVLDMIKTIAQAAQEESKASELISSNVINITEIINKNSERVGVLNSSTQELSNNTESLRHLINKFKLDETSVRETSTETAPRNESGRGGRPTGLRPI
ncbi:MAG: HAMP domain-containing protein [Candidatus Delongbacteria bacterium]|nr:HAMP domain-containing protein [Candidatus Delongbacteria bacterium]